MQTLTPGSILGHAVRRREDPRLVTGAGHYVDDLQPEGCLHIAFVRSTLAHAEIRSVDVQAAAAAPGVVAVLTGADLGLPDRVGFAMVAATLARAPLATERVRFVGEPVALVIAESAGQAEDAAQLDRKSTRLNSSHQIISYAVFCLKKKKQKRREKTPRQSN